MRLNLRKLIPSFIEEYLPVSHIPIPRKKDPLYLRLWRFLFPLRVAQEQPRPKEQTKASLFTRLRYWLFPRPLTPAEKAELKAAKLREAENKRAKAEAITKAKTALKDIRRTLHNQQIYYTYTNPEKKGKRIREVPFMWPPDVGLDQCVWRINTGELYGVNLAQLSDEHLLNVISSNVGHPVRFFSNPGNGKWKTGYQIYFSEDARGIPAHVAFDEMLQTAPAYVRDNPFAVAIGIGEHRKPIWFDLRDGPHMLICGTTGYGKSNDVNLLLSQLIQRCRPEKMRLILVDLKRLELNEYADIPHIIPIPRTTLKKKRSKKANPAEDEETMGEEVDLLTAAESASDDTDDFYDRFKDEYSITVDTSKSLRIVRNAEDVPGVLYHVIKLIAQRTRIMSEHPEHPRKLSEYNQLNRGNPLPYVFVIIDEFAELMSTAGLGEISTRMLTSAMNLGRALGVHFILTTQTPTAKIMESGIRNNLPFRIVHFLRDPYVSRALVGSDEACTLNHRGRAIMVDNEVPKPMQVARVNNEHITAAITYAKTGAYPAPAVAKKREHDVTEEEVLLWSIKENNGSLSQKSLYEKYKARGVNQNWAQAFGPDRINKTFLIENAVYKVFPSVGPKPVCLMPDTEKQ